MTLNDLICGEPWMDPEEHESAAELVRSIQQSFIDRQIPETPFLVLRVQDFLLHHTLCRRLERSLIPDPAAVPPVTVLPSLAEHIGKARDRMRKALKELEDAAAKLAPPPLPANPSAAKLTMGNGLPAAKTANPLDDPDFCQAIIEKAGIDLNDPDFFADEDNFYDVPPYRRPSEVESNPDPAVTPAQAGAQAPDLTPAQKAQPPEPVLQPPAPSPSPLSIVHSPLSIAPAARACAFGAGGVG